MASLLKELVASDIFFFSLARSKNSERRFKERLHGAQLQYNSNIFHEATVFCILFYQTKNVKKWISLLFSYSRIQFQPGAQREL